MHFPAECHEITQLFLLKVSPFYILLDKAINVANIIAPFYIICYIILKFE